MIKLKKGDKVKINIGKDRAKEGVIEKVIPKTKKAIVIGVNIYKKHVKGVADQKGGIYDITRPLLVSKLSLICPKCKKKTRIGFKNVAGQKVRICRKCNREIDTKKVKK